MRLDKFLANMGVGSRKDVKRLMQTGSITVNGNTVKDPGTNISEGLDIICVNGRKITYKEFVYLMMNKPQDYVSATESKHGEKIVTDLIGEDYSFYKPAPAGRLDIDTEGFLLLTNDGNFIHNIISPTKHVFKTYYLEAEGHYGEDAALRVEQGIKLDDGMVTLPGKLEVISQETGMVRAYMTIREGKFHQVKKMSAALGAHVTYLKRLSIGGVKLDENLPLGGYRELTDEEFKRLSNFQETINEETDN